MSKLIVPDDVMKEFYSDWLTSDRGCGDAMFPRYIANRAAQWALQQAKAKCELLAGDYDRFSDIDSRNAAIACDSAIGALSEGGE